MSTDSVTPSRRTSLSAKCELIVEPCSTAEQDIMPARLETKNLGA
jgi:hypothetical protein